MKPSPASLPTHSIWMEIKANHLSKLCRTMSALTSKSFSADGQAASALHIMAVLQVYQAQLLRDMDKSVLDPADFKKLRSATHLALHATKATAQAIRHAMASLEVLKRHLWLNLTEIKDADRTALLDSPIFHSGLFGFAVDGFAKRFIAAQKSSEAMHHFLPKRVAPSAASHLKLPSSTLQHPRPASCQLSLSPRWNLKINPKLNCASTRPNATPS